ncbi:MAG TPA: GIY-YIG nuclease family protein [Tissierellaceae bacterium]|nr:GIY-YIG nuclease family protein [Tissierellaceae bacterium]
MGRQKPHGKTGIYSITNKSNKKRYIGLSKDIGRRWDSHKYELRRNTHCNAHLQNSWNKHGENMFRFEILEICETYELEDKELYWIDKFNSCEDGYNILYGAGDYSNLHRDEQGGCGKYTSIVEPFYVFNRYSMEYLGEFNDVNMVSDIFDVNYYSVFRVLNKDAGYASAFEFIYKDEYIDNGNKTHSEKNRSKHKKGFYIVDLMNGEHKHFHHPEHGASYFGLPDTSVITLRLIEDEYPVWNFQYWIGSWDTFHSIGSVESIIEKYTKFYFATECNLDNNYYSIYNDEEDFYERIV